MANDLLKQSINIIKAGVKDFGAQYGENLNTLTNDAKTIRDNVQHTSSSVSETFARIKSRSLAKRASDWFYQREADTDDYDVGNDDFDSGMPDDNDSDSNSSTSVSNLNADEMRDITKGQMNAVFGSAGRISEVNTANTAEIITAMNERSSEMVASINKVNSTLLHISSQFDTFMSYHASVQQALVTEQQKQKLNTQNNGVLNSSGQLSIAGIVNNAKSNLKENTSILSLAQTLASNSTPSSLVSMLLSSLSEKVKVPGTNGKTVDEIGKQFNQAVGTVTQTVLSELIEAPVFKKLFSDLTKRESNTDFSRHVVNQYTTAPAVFDGMTRMSIINVIPEYLKKINESISGETWSVSSNGTLQKGPNANNFSKVADKAFQSSGINYDTQNSLVNETRAIDRNISQSDIDTAAKALTSAYVMYLYHVGKTNLRASQISPNDMRTLKNAVQILTYSTGKSDAYWSPICMAIVQRLSTNLNEANTFVQNVNVNLDSMFSEATEYASTNPFAFRDAGKITDSMVMKQFKEQYAEYNGDKIKNKSPILDSQIGNKSKEKTTFDQLDYLRGTFDILNRGINVRVTNDFTKDNSGFDKYVLTKINKPANVNKINNTAKSDDNDDDIDPDSNTPYLDKIKNKLVPSSIRTSMQFFGNAFDTVKGVTGEVKNKFNEKANENGGDNIFNSLKNLVSPTIDKVTNLGNKADTKIFGNEVTDLKGNTFRRGGLINAVKDKATEIKTKVTDASQTIIDNHNAKRDYNNIVKEVDSNTSGDISMADQMAAQNVFALMQTSVQDGNTDADIGPIMNAIGEIKDDNLRSRVSTSVMGMLKRSESKAASGGGILSKILGGGKLLLTKIFSPVITVIKGVITVIKTIGGKILKFLGRMFKDGAITAGVGLKNMGQALFGQREKTDADGNVTQQKQKGLIRQLLLDPDMAVFKTATKLITKVTQLTASIYTKTAKAIKNSFTSEDGFLHKVTKSITKGVKTAMSKVSGVASSALNKIKNTKFGQAVSSFGDKIKNKFDGSGGTSEFMKGFKGVFAEARDAKEKSRLKSIKVETVADRESIEMTEMLTGKKDSLISKISDSLTAIFKKINNGEDTSTDETTSDENDTTEEEALENRSGIQMTSNTETSKFGRIKNSKLGQKFAGSKVGKFASSTIGKLSGTSSAAAGITMSSGGAAAGATGGAGGIAGSLGKLAGGFGASLIGLLQMIATAITGLEGFKALGELLPNLINQIIEPLNKIFFSIIKFVQPILDIVGKQLGMVVDIVSSVLSGIIDSLMPLVQMITDTLTPILEILQPVFNILMALVNVVMAPLVGVVQFVITPILRQVGNTLEIISGMIQLGMGNVMTALGAILMGIGTVISILPFGSDGILNTGKEMFNSGISMSKSGITSIASGTAKFVMGALDPLDISGVNGSKDDEKKEEKKDTGEKKESTGGSAMEGLVGSGDVNTYNNTDNHSIIHNIYGSGDNNQGAYGYTMNMRDHGCGPVALADAYSRRTGKNINPVKVATSMRNTGAYDPNRGTSVSGFIQAGNNAGLNLRPGNVTRNAIKSASPNNPITVVGSGPDFATKKGNIHYMNVIGSDKAGGVYVSNPITGGVKRRPMNGVLSNSIMGLYGSGDTDGYQFDESVTDAMTNLTSITDSLLNIFNGPSSEEQMQDKVNEEKDKEAIKQAQLSLGTDEFAKYESKGYALFQKENPKRDGESDDAYKARYEKVKDKYTTLAAKDDIVKQNTATYDGINKAANELNEKANAAANNTFKAGGEMAAAAAEDAESGDDDSTYTGTGGEFVSDSGVKLGVTYTPTITENNITSAPSDKTPLHEFFKKTSGAKKVFSWDFGWYNKGTGPDKNGQGSSGRVHNGVDFIYNSQDNFYNSEGGFPIISPIDGNVVYTSGGSAYNNGLGNSVNIKDSSGYIHRFMHMISDPIVKIGDKVTGGKTKLGNVGTTGASTCNHLHYDIGKGNDGGPPNTTVNPFTFYKYKPPTGAAGLKDGKKIKMTSDMKQGDVWETYVKKYGKDKVKKFIDAGKMAGMSAAEIATLGSTGIWEDSGAKIFGFKDLNGVTTDINGQNAVGIMNFVDTSVDYGDSVLDQLKYIHNAYFAKNPTRDDVARVNNNRNMYDDQFKQLTGYDLHLKVGDKYGEYMSNTDLTEGSTHFFGTALVPGCFNPKGIVHSDSMPDMAEYIGTTVGAYNWMMDNGYIRETFTKADNLKQNTDDDLSKLSSTFTPTAAQSAIDKMSANNKTNTAKNSPTYTTTISANTHGGSSGKIDGTGSTTHKSSSGNTHGGLSGTFGSGDFDSDFPMSDYMNNSYNNSNVANIINDTNDSSLFDDALNGMNLSYNDTTIPTVVTNKYLIKSDDSMSREKLRMILTNTYNVKAERVEALLEKIITLLDNNNNGRGTGNRSGNNNKPLDLFDNNNIPAQVSKLSIG